MGFLFSDVDYQSTEIGYIMILPAFQRTHVCTNAVGLLLHYCLELPTTVLHLAPSDADRRQRFGPGLGLRRVQWQAHADNAPSIATAERIGFRKEGIIRWDRIVRGDKPGLKVPPHRAALNAGSSRWTCRLSICWDDWEAGVREKVQQQMDRVKG
jgi:RimJ/RimL family protein N-acetyltransferase